MSRKPMELSCHINVFFYLRNKHILTKVFRFSESTTKIKITLRRVFFLILLTSEAISQLKFLHGKEVAQYLLNYQCCRLHLPDFEKFEN